MFLKIPIFARTNFPTKTFGRNFGTNFQTVFYAIKRQPHKIVKHTQTILWGWRWNG